MLRTFLLVLTLPIALVACKDAGSDDSGDNAAPSLDEVTLDPTELYEDTRVTCVPSGWLDADGDAEQYHFLWLVNGTEVGTSATLDGDAFNKGDEVICEVTPFDGESEGAPVSSAPATVRNTPPEVPTAVIDPDPPHRGSALSVAFPGASDADGDALTASVRWYVNGAEVSVLEQLSPDFFVRGDSVYAVADVGDGESEALTLVTPTATVGNALPVVTAVRFAPAALLSSGEVTAEVSAEDADGDAFTLSYAWFVNGQQIAEYTNTLSADQWASRDDSVYVSVTANDGVGTGPEALSETLVVQNTPPDPPTVEASPERPGEGLWPLVCEPTAGNDYDGDPVSVGVRWAVDGVAFTDTTTTNIADDTVPAEFQLEGQEWTCYAWSNDGRDDGEESTWTVSIGPAYEALELDGRTMTLSGGIHDYSTITLINGATLYVSGETTLRAYSISVDDSSAISGEGGGYGGGSAEQSGSGRGGGAGSGSLSSRGGAGAGHGGEGGDGGYDLSETGATGGSTAGTDEQATIEQGAGGGAGGAAFSGSSGGGDGGDGGAALTLSAETISIAGILSVNGEAGSRNSVTGASAGGGGAGGGLLILTEAVTFTGTAVLEARGGDGATANSSTGDGGGGGGGGRIKMFYETSYSAASGTVFSVDGGAGGTGGSAADGQTGSTGTIFDAEAEYSP